MTQLIHPTAGPNREDESDTGFARRVRSAVAWRWGTQVLAQIITWTSTILVVRLLEPTDYGLFAMAHVVLTALFFLNGQSFATSLVQTHDISERRIGQVFGLLLLLNAGLGITQFLTAPLAAAYFGEPVLADMLRVLALSYLFIPFSVLPQELLARRIEFRNQGIVNLCAAAAGAGVALSLAWYGYGVWALVYAPIAIFGVRAIGLTMAARLLVKPVFDFRGAGDLFRFGGALTLCQLLWIIQSQSDIVIAGRAFETHDLGLYSEALFLTLIVTGRFLPPINEVAYPAYSELHKAGKSLAPYFLRTLRTVLLVTAPLYIGLSLTAEPAVLMLFGDKWAEMGPIVAGLAIAMPFFALQIVCSPATNAMGKPRVYLTSNAIGAILFPSLFLIAIAFGPMGLVRAWWVGAPLLLFATLTITLPHVGLAPLRLLRELAPIALACGIMASVVSGTDSLMVGWLPILRLAVLVPLGMVSFFAAMWLLKREYLEETIEMVRERRIAAIKVA